LRLYTISRIYYIVCQGMRTSDNTIREVILTDKGKGHLCLLCQKPTGSKNIPICEDCVIDNNIFRSLAIIKETLYIHKMSDNYCHY
jgi:hypothetical protein